MICYDSVVTTIYIYIYILYILVVCIHLLFNYLYIRYNNLLLYNTYFVNISDILINIIYICCLYTLDNSSYIVKKLIFN